jgi:hypothetical protein
MYHFAEAVTGDSRDGPLEEPFFASEIAPVSDRGTGPKPMSKQTTTSARA